MARCPFGPHRLILTETAACKHCAADMRLYAALLDLPATLYNVARRQWEEANFKEAAPWLHAALRLRPDFPEAHWLMAVVEGSLDRPDRAEYHWTRARDLGVDIRRDWEGVISTETAGRENSQDSSEQTLGEEATDRERKSNSRTENLPEPDLQIMMKATLSELKDAKGQLVEPDEPDEPIG